MKPPGGGSSDIFGGEMMTETPRSTKNHMRSNIFSEPEPMAKNGELHFGNIYFGSNYTLKDIQFSSDLI